MSYKTSINLISCIISYIKLTQVFQLYKQALGLVIGWWKSRMKDLLCHKDLYAPLESDDANPKDTSNGEWKKLDMAVRFIQQWLDDTIFALCFH